MKTHYFIIFLFFIFCQSCKKDLPSTITIVKGNLVDENNNPLEGIRFQVYGYYTKGISPISTFNEIMTTDKQGNFRFEMLITKPTKVVEVQPFDGFF